MSFLEWLHNSSLAQFVQESLWGYPVILSCHALGMAALAGVVLMIDFRVLGFGRAVPIAPLKILMKVALAGFILNVVSGVMLFAADAVSFFGNTPFRLKILLLLIGGVLLLIQSRQIFGPAAGPDVADSRSAKLLAALSVAVWVGVIVSGRLIAYAKLY